MSDKKLEIEIQNLKDELQNYEDTDPAYMNEEMKGLRHFVLYTHLRMEESLGRLITRGLLEPLISNDKFLSEDLRNTYKAGADSLAEVSFYHKLQMAYAHRKIDEKVNNIMQKVNKLRNCFSHPGKYDKELFELKIDRKKYFEALKNLVAAHQEMNKLYSGLLIKKNS